MTVGETLAGARHRAGLSVDELGQRTKIRGQVIRAIEQDDFESCGGTLYVRGYVRVIAGAVGVDAQPLLRELDQVGGVSGAAAPEGFPGPSRPARRPPRPPQPPRPARGPETPAPGSGGWGAPPTPMPPAPDVDGRFGRLERLKRLKAAEDAASRSAGTGRRTGAMRALKRSGPIKVARDDTPDPTIVDMMRAVPPDEDVVPGMEAIPESDASVRETSFDLPALGDDRAPGGPRFDPGPPARSGSGFGPPPAPPRPQERRTFQPPPAGGRNDGGGFLRDHRKGVTALVVVVAVVFVFYAFSQMFSAGGSGGGAPASAGGASPSASSAATGALTVSNCQAYGPNGTADGDNPTTASYPITPGSGQPWITQQYSSPQFGGQKAGSGLLLDMGKTVTVSGVSVDLGSTSGAGLELKAGNSPTALNPVSTVTNVSGNVQIRPGKPVTARYLLIWFNQLPQASDGQYQGSVYHVSVEG